MGCQLNEQGLYVCGSGVPSEDSKKKRKRRSTCKTDWMCERTCELGTRTCFINHVTSDTSRTVETTGEKP